MRAEVVEKSLKTFLMYNGTAMCYKVHDPENLTDEQIEKQGRENYRQAENVIRSNKCEGYILHQDVVYKIPANGAKTIKITGTEAKAIKRKFKDNEKNILSCALDTQVEQNPEKLAA